MVKGTSFGSVVHKRYYFTERGDKRVLFSDRASELDEASTDLVGCFAHRSMPSHLEVQRMTLENLESPGRDHEAIPREAKRAFSNGN